MALEIKTAEELIDPELEARWAARRADRQGDVLQCIVRLFIEQEGRVPVEEISLAFSDRSPDAVGKELTTLHEKDLILLGDGHVDLAYPFSGVPTAFTVVLSDGRKRFACCAIDALGVAAMLRECIDIRSRCHHCGDPLEFWADAEGPSLDSSDVMVWIGKRCEGERRISTSL